MEFWGIEIKPGSPLRVEPEDGYIIHISQVALGESNKVKDENVVVYVKVGDAKKKLVIGNLSNKIPQIYLDVNFEQDFELSHECTSSSVFLLGYKSPDGDSIEEQDSDFDSEEEGAAMGFPGSNMNGAAGESDSDEEEGEEYDEAPLKVEPPSKKRPNGEAMNNNTVASKKAKVAIQQKPSGGGKKTMGKSGTCGSSCKH